MKIGILTLFHGNCNWGGVLQGYALKTLIETKIPDAKADLLIYKGSNIVYTSRIRQVMQYSTMGIVQKVAKRLIGKRGCRELLVNRTALFHAFMREQISNPRKYDDETLIDAAREYDCLISGSDQVWNPNVGWAGFFQAMITDECKKIAYAASIARDDLSVYERSVMMPLVERFDAVSVREKTAKVFLERYSSNGLKVEEVLDPALMLSKEEWSKFSEKSTLSFDGRYAIAFFFSESRQYREKISKYCKLHGLELKFIPFARGEYIASDEKGEADRLYDLGPYEFVRLFRNTQCVFTDSFHGTVFSIIFQKPFCVFERDKKSKVSKNSRLYDLLEKFGLSSRLVRDKEVFDCVMDAQIDYEAISVHLNQLKKESFAFLEKELVDCHDKPLRKRNHVGDMEKHDCCGCSLCTMHCPQKCIEMKMDSEGFQYPAVNEVSCIRCGLCLNTCVSKTYKENLIKHDAHIGFHKEQAVREKSSSGGLFYALAKEVLLNDGFVYGAGYAEDFSVCHMRVSNLDELPRLMTSKYVQSSMENTIGMIWQDLKNGRQVLFSGTPCQVAAVNAWAVNKHCRDNLLLVDFICHGVPSPGVWKSYVRFLCEMTGTNPRKISFRDKSKGWHDFCFKADFDDCVIRESHELNAYMRSFLSNRNIRPSCYDCRFKGETYFSDVTLGDAWKIEKDYPQWADDRGTSLVIVRTQKASDVLSQAQKFVVSKPTSYDVWTKFNPSLEESTHRPIGRKAFFDDFTALNHNAFWEKYRRIPAKKLLRYAAKKILKFIGMDKMLRKVMG